MKVGIYSLAFASDVEAAHQLQPLGMNVRTLQRDRVIRYLQNPGYSMPSSFTRWFSAQGFQINYSNLAYG